MDETRTVLLVDDDPDFVAANRVTLEARGYAVVVARSGDECLAAVSESRPDLIVLDIMMKTTGDGMFVAQALRRDAATRGIPIIVASSVNRTPPYNIGPDDAWLPVDVFVEKPVAPEVLLDLVAREIGRAKTHVEYGSA